MSASFRYKLDEQRRTSRWPIKPLFDKQACRQMFDVCGVGRPRVVARLRALEELEAEHLADPAVVKPANGHSGRGVMALSPNGGNWIDLITEKQHSLDDIRAALAAARDKWDLAGGWAIEQLVVGRDGKLPNDIKVYAFHGVVGLVLVRTAEVPHRYRWFDPELNPTKVGKDWYTIDTTLRPPDQSTLDSIAKVSQRIPVPFLRIDVYEGRDGLMFGELTPYPGGYNSFNKTWDERLGQLYEVAESDLLRTGFDPSRATEPALWRLLFPTGRAERPPEDVFR